jgi:predicted nucleic acid-binding protein
VNAAFFDTNLFIYMDDPLAPAKRRRAIDLLEEYAADKKAIVSLQVMQEYYSVATRKNNVDPAIAQAKVELMKRLRVVQFGAEDVLSSIELHRVHQVSFWDAHIIHAARIGGADTLFSEDLQHGSRIAGVKIVNPFLESAAA